jgi:hypothetical protein
MTGAGKDQGRMVWVTIGRTQHAAYQLAENENGYKQVRWIATGQLEWLAPDVPFSDELPSRRRGRQPNYNVSKMLTDLASSSAEKASPEKKPEKKGRRARTKGKKKAVEPDDNEESDFEGLSKKSSKKRRREHNDDEDAEEVYKVRRTTKRARAVEAAKHHHEDVPDSDQKRPAALAKSKKASESISMDSDEEEIEWKLPETAEEVAVAKKPAKYSVGTWVAKVRPFFCFHAAKNK